MHNNTTINHNFDVDTILKKKQNKKNLLDVEVMQSPQDKTEDIRFEGVVENLGVSLRFYLLYIKTQDKQKKQEQRRQFQLKQTPAAYFHFFKHLIQNSYFLLAKNL